MSLWSLQASMRQTHAPSYSRQIAERIITMHPSENLRLERIPTYPRAISALELDQFGFGQFTDPLHQNANHPQTPVGQPPRARG